MTRETDSRSEKLSTDSAVDPRGSITLFRCDEVKREWRDLERTLDSLSIGPAVRSVMTRPKVNATAQIITIVMTQDKR